MFYQTCVGKPCYHQRGSFYTLSATQEMSGYFICTPDYVIHLKLNEKRSLGNTDSKDRKSIKQESESFDRHSMKKQLHPIGIEEEGEMMSKLTRSMIAYDCSKNKPKIKTIGSIKNIGEKVDRNDMKALNGLSPKLSRTEWLIALNSLTKDYRYFINGQGSDQSKVVLMAHNGVVYAMSCPSAKVWMTEEQCYDHIRVQEISDFWTETPFSFSQLQKKLTAPNRECLCITK